MLLFHAEHHHVVVLAPDRAPIELAPAPDVSKLPGARVVAWLGLEHGAGRIAAGCVLGPSDRFALGLEQVLYEKATYFSLTALAIQPQALAVERTGREGHVLEQRLRGRSADAPFTLHHTITFTGEDRDLLLCSAACLGDACSPRLLAIEGEPQPPPEPGLGLRAVLLAANHPRQALGAAALVTLMVCAWILVRRPRPRPQLTRP